MRRRISSKLRSCPKFIGTNERKLTRAEAGELIGLSQPEVSRMFKGNFHEYSIERLNRLLKTFIGDGK